MATKRKASESDLTDEQKQHLLWGRVFFGDRGCFPFDSDEHRRAVWFQHREMLIVDPDLARGRSPQAQIDYEEEEQC
jgi:hypothetical protein